MRGKMVIESEADFETWRTAQQTFEQSRKSDASRDKRASLNDAHRCESRRFDIHRR